MDAVLKSVDATVRLVPPTGKRGRMMVVRLNGLTSIVPWNKAENYSENHRRAIVAALVNLGDLTPNLDAIECVGPSEDRTHIGYKVSLL